MLGSEFLNGRQVTEGRKLVDDVGGNVVLQVGALHQVLAVVTSRNRHRVGQDGLKNQS